MNFRLPAISSIFLLILALPAYGQGRGASPTQGQPAESISVVVRVTAQNGEPLAANAEVTLSPEGGFGQQLMTNGNLDVQFRLGDPGRYEIEVTAAGYKTGRASFDVDTTRQAVLITVPLSPESTDTGTVPTAILLAPKAQKEMEKGIASIKSGNYNDAKTRLLAARKIAPGDSGINYLLGFTLLALKEFDDAQKYLVMALTLDAKNMSALVTMGRLHLEMRHPEAAEEPLQRAISIDATSWQAHWLLADTYRQERKYEESVQEAKLAIESGKGAADGARLVLAQALVGLGKREEAIQAFRDFLSGAQDGAAKEYAQGQIAALEAKVLAEQLEPQTEPNVASTLIVPPPEKRPRDDIPVADDLSSAHGIDATATLPSWKPPSVSQSAPRVLAGVACPAARVISGAGANVTDLVAHLNSIDATEELIHQPLDEIGRPTETEKKYFDYLVTIGETRPGTMQVSEVRNGTTDPKIFPGGLATLGVPALALVFHPSLRGDYDMACEGLGDLHGQPAWIVHFVQKSGRPGRLRSYRINGVDHLLSMEGRAWIAKDSFQILRVETDLVHPMPEIELVSDHMEVNYQAVQFRERGETFWLPSSAQMYFEFRKQRYRRSVTLSHYRLFAVGATQQINQPEAGNGGRE